MTKNNAKFLKLVAQYADTEVNELTANMRFRDDLGFTSLAFMTFLGDLEDAFDIEIDEERVMQITTIGEALEYINEEAA